MRVKARTRDRTSALTCSRGPPGFAASRPAAPSAAYLLSHRSTVGRDTPASAAMSFFIRPSACHNTIRARVPTAADTSVLVVRARSSARWSDVSSTRTANHTNVT